MKMLDNIEGWIIIELSKVTNNIVILVYDNEGGRGISNYIIIEKLHHGCIEVYSKDNNSCFKIIL